MEKVRLTIDGQAVEVAKGTTVLEAAQAAGIYIPTLCYDPDLEPYGGCRARGTGAIRGPGEGP